MANLVKTFLKKGKQYYVEERKSKVNKKLLSGCRKWGNETVHVSVLALQLSGGNGLKRIQSLQTQRRMSNKLAMMSQGETQQEQKMN